MENTENFLKTLKGMTEEDARAFISLMFDGYISRKEKHKLFENSSMVQEMIILTYYYCIKNPEFKSIYQEFKNRYIDNNEFKEKYLYNENKLERVHSKEEQKGLSLVYDYIQSKEDFDDISIYTLSDVHQILYSQVPYPEFGGQYRKDERYLPYTGTEIVSSDLIVHEMNLLRNEVEQLRDDAINLGKNINPIGIMPFIDRCVELKCKLLKIHPFGDGNGRSIRAFINILFKAANLPPIYIEDSEREKYHEALQLAHGEGNYEKIKHFYYYKICDSIISLDVAINQKEAVDTKII